MFKDHLAGLGAAIDQHLGEDATWTGIAGTVRVHDEAADDTVRYGGNDVIVSTRVIRVRRTWVPAPKDGDELVLLGTAETLRVTGDPILDEEGFWACTVAEA